MKHKKSNSWTGSVRDEEWSQTFARNSRGEQNKSLNLSKDHKSKWDSAPRLKASKAKQKAFVKTADYNTYCLINKPEWYYSDITLTIAKLEKTLRSKVSERDINERTLVYMISFLKTIRGAYSSIGNHKLVATRIYSYFTEKPASSSLKT